jgi:phage FluMu protein Com
MVIPVTLLEFAELTSPVPLSEWQHTFFRMYEQAVKDGKELICIPGRCNGRKMVKDIVGEYYHPGAVNVYCQGTKKIGIPCKRYLGKVEGKAELLCPICKTVNVVDGGKITVKERECHESINRG